MSFNSCLDFMRSSKPVETIVNLEFACEQCNHYQSDFNTSFITPFYFHQIPGNK